MLLYKMSETNQNEDKWNINESTTPEGNYATIPLNAFEGKQKYIVKTNGPFNCICINVFVILGYGIFVFCFIYFSPMKIIAKIIIFIIIFLIELFVNALQIKKIIKKVELIKDVQNNTLEINILNLFSKSYFEFK